MSTNQKMKAIKDHYIDEGYKIFKLKKDFEI